MVKCLYIYIYVTAVYLYMALIQSVVTRALISTPCLLLGVSLLSAFFCISIYIYMNFKYFSHMCPHSVNVADLRLSA